MAHQIFPLLSGVALVIGDIDCDGNQSCHHNCRAKCQGCFPSEWIFDGFRFHSAAASQHHTPLIDDQDKIQDWFIFTVFVIFFFIDCVTFWRGQGRPWQTKARARRWRSIRMWKCQCLITRRRTARARCLLWSMSVRRRWDSRWPGQRGGTFQSRTDTGRVSKSQ